MSTSQHAARAPRVSLAECLATRRLLQPLPTFLACSPFRAGERATEKATDKRGLFCEREAGMQKPTMDGRSEHEI